MRLTWGVTYTMKKKRGGGQLSNKRGGVGGKTLKEEGESRGEKRMTRKKRNNENMKGKR